MPRRALSEEVVQQQRGRALQAALELFIHQGVEAVSVRSVASALELSPMALYRYFPGGKGELLATLRGQAFEDLATQLEQAAAGVDEPIDRILSLTRAMVRFGTSQPGLYRLMFDVTQPEERDEYLAVRRERAWRPAVEAFDAAVRAGLLSGERELLPHLFFAAVHGIIVFELSMQPDPRRRLERLLGPMVETFFRGSGGGSATLRKVRQALRGKKSPLAHPE